MIAAHYGKKLKLQTIRDYCEIDRDGVSLYGIFGAAERLGFHSVGKKIDSEDLKNAIKPCILHWNQNHFVVLYHYSDRKYIIADPAKGIIRYREKEFLEQWTQGRDTGIALLLTPCPEFLHTNDVTDDGASFKRFFFYIIRFRKLLVQLVLGYLVGSFLQVLIPFLTQSVVDIGIPTQDLSFVNLVLIAQSALLIGRTFVDFIRSWILLHISTRLNIFVLADFLSKLMRLPISFFDSKKTGDIMQRIDDQRRIETFLTGQTLNISFSILNLIVFSFVLIFYNINIFLVFFLGTTLYTVWILAFLKRRKLLDNKRFDISSKTQSITIQLIQGMQDIKLSGTENQKRWDWEHLQAKLFSFNVKSLALGQYQQAGGLFFNEGKNLFITFLAAKAVISGEMTLGQMIVIQYIIGQLSNPIEQFLSFIQSYQDARLSLFRLNELFSLEDEENADKKHLKELPLYNEIRLEKLTFNYPGHDPVLKDINLIIPKGKTTAIVGTSGSGKSTLIKLLLGFYPLQQGCIRLGETDLERLSPHFWRMQCGIVTQDSFIFSDTIASNITLSEKKLNPELLDKAIKLVCLDEYINTLPLGVDTLIGAEGNGMSYGQRQRLLIARAVYKQPKFILFDEATNSLDANNERKIVENLENFFSGRTVVIVAHRLSTVKNADKIVVLENGTIAEIGTHKELANLKGKYFELVKNQLELGN
jgi:ATP-binding cassette subfamily B protein